MYPMVKGGDIQDSAFKRTHGRFCEADEHSASQNMVQQRTSILLIGKRHRSICGIGRGKLKVMTARERTS
jgi:hypothetical protein